MRLTIIRGLPGCGKSTFVAKTWPTAVIAPLAVDNKTPRILSADQFFTNWKTGGYCWNPKDLGEAFAWETVQLVQAMRDGVPEIIRDNTHSRIWEYRVAGELAEVFGYEVRIIDLFDCGCCDDELAYRGIHNVPAHIIANMRERWEPDVRAVPVPIE